MFTRRRRRRLEWRRPGRTRLKYFKYKRRIGQSTAYYRGISLVGHAAKALLKIITGRLSAYCEPRGILSEELYSFRPGQLSTDVLFEVRQLPPLGQRKGNLEDMCYIGLPRAYDSVDRTFV